MALDLQLKVINNVKGKADRFCQLIFRGIKKVSLEREKHNS